MPCYNDSGLCISHIEKGEDVWLTIKYKLEQCLQVHNKDELVDLCQMLMIPGDSRKKKAELAAMAAKELLNPLVMKYRLCTLPEYGLGLFELIGREGMDAESFDEQKPMGKTLLYETWYVYADKDNRVFIPSDVWEVYQSFSDHGWKKWRNECFWLLECMYFANMLYGVTPMSVLGKLFRTHPDYDDSDILVEAKTVLLPAYLLNARSVEKADVFSYGLQERCLVFDAYQHPEDRNALLKQQKDKPFYIPSWTEIEELYERLYLKETPTYQRLSRFLIRVLKKDEQCYSAVPFAGINKDDISACSRVSSFIFLSIPPAYPVRLPLEPTTRWHGMIREMRL